MNIMIQLKEFENDLSAYSNKDNIEKPVISSIFPSFIDHSK